MALSIQEQGRYWGIGLAVAVLFLWLLGDILLPFVIGMSVAYFLDPTADKLEKWGLSRLWATVIITFIAVLCFIVLAVVLLPQLIEQLAALISAVPNYIRQFQEFLTTKFPSIMDEASPVRQGIDALIETAQADGGKLAAAIVQSAFSLIDAVIIIVVAPVVGFYMLMDWDRMIAKIDSWLPRDHTEVLRGLAREVDQVLAGFVRGQLTVCMILGGFYAVALVAVGLQFGLVVGLIAGLLTFIPYVGSLIGGILSVGLALFQFWGTPEWIVVVAIIFIVGQFVEGNFLTPKLVGSSVGLHPVWLMFSLSAFGALLGFTGMLIAVPVAACLGVFFRFGIQQYLEGRLYTGSVGKMAEDQDG